MASDEELAGDRPDDDSERHWTKQK
jgi:hypothetical protein